MSPAVLLAPLVIAVLSGYFSSISSFQRPSLVLNNRTGLVLYNRYLKCSPENETRQLNLMLFGIVVLCITYVYVAFF